MQSSKRIFISNRLPFNIHPKTGAVQRGTGGLVSALLGVDLDEPFWWVGFETNKKSAELLVKNTSSIQKNLRLKPVIIDPGLYDRYYDGFCNDVLWPLFHYESQHTYFNQDSWNAYKHANQLMADEILRIAGPSDTVWIHDFHFLLLPQMLKDKQPNLKVGLFLHIPFPSSEIFRQLPTRYDILTALSRADLIGFHDSSYLRHFSISLNTHVGADLSFFKARIGSHTLNMGVYPISIDTKDYSEKSKSPAVEEQVKRYFDEIRSDYLVLGVDRLDYSKGLELKLEGFRRMLQKYPETRGHINLLQVAVPTRVKVPTYARLKKQVDQLVGKINGEFGQPGYVPVQYIYNSIEETKLIALYRRAEALLVTSKRDGMNLVAMEYAISQNPETPGSVIVSEFAGVSSLLSHAIITNPWDYDSVADAIYASYKMSKTKRRERLDEMQSVLLTYSATEWANNFLSDLDAVQPHEPAIPVPKDIADWPQDLRLLATGNKKTTLILDYDGTVVSLKTSPEKAVLEQSTRDLLLRLNEKYELVIISGRDRAFLDSQFADIPIRLVAEHGGFHRENGDWVSRIVSNTDSWKSEVTRLMSTFCKRVPGSFVEEKEASVVWHFRRSPKNFADFQARKLQDELHVCMANLPVIVSFGSKIVEAKASECNKGAYLHYLFEQNHDRRSIVIGDDITDEDMFRVLEHRGVSIRVGPGATSANLRLAEQSDVIPFLQNLADSRPI